MHRFLFPAMDTPAPGLSIEPVARFVGVPDYYLLHLLNPRRPDAAGGYIIHFTNEVGKSIHIPTEAETFTIAPAGGADQPVVIPLGDLDDNGYNDYIAGVREDVSVPVTIARVVFGSGTTGEVMLPRRGE
jgi:hypothetical protein